MFPDLTTDDIFRIETQAALVALAASVRCCRDHKFRQFGRMSRG